ncbi:hypothetical protein FA364_05290, partial [Pseudomonas aeruginosa]|nr:hypothetical protein [Pseudomonas aeruginosa]
MFAATRLTRLRHDTSRILSHWILPLGWLALLTGMFWVGDRSDYHRLFYIPVSYTHLTLPTTS